MTDRLVRMGMADLQRLQVFQEACDDFILLSSGGPPTGNEALELLTELPPGRSLEHKQVWALVSDGGEIQAAIDVVYGYPDDASAFLGLLLLRPSVRGQGVGARLTREVEQKVRSAGMEWLYLGVLECNPAAHRFWSREGFQDVDQRVIQVGSLSQPVWRMRKSLHR